MTEILNLCGDHKHRNPLFSRCSSLWWSSIKLSLATKRIMSSEGTETYCDYISLATKRIMSSEGTETYCDYISLATKRIMSSEGTETYCDYISLATKRIMSSEGTETYCDYISLATKRIMSSEGTETYCDYISPHCDFDLEDSNLVYTAWYSTSWWCTTIHRYCPDKTWTGRCTGGIQDVSKFLNLAYHPPPQGTFSTPPPPPPPAKKKKRWWRGGSWETELSPSKTEDLLCQMGFSSSWKQTKSTP